MGAGPGFFFSGRPFAPPFFSRNTAFFHDFLKEFGYQWPVERPSVETELDHVKNLSILKVLASPIFFWNFRNNGWMSWGRISREKGYNGWPGGTFLEKKTRISMLG